MCAIASSGLAHSVSRPSVSMTRSSRPGLREARPGQLRAGERQGHQAPARLVLVRREPGRPFEHRARRAGDLSGGALGGRHRLEEGLRVADHAAAEVAARDDHPAVIVRAAHRVRGDAPRVGVALEHVEGLVVDDRLGDRQVGRGDRELEDRASLAVGCCGVTSWPRMMQPHPPAPSSRCTRGRTPARRSGGRCAAGASPPRAGSSSRSGTLAGCGCRCAAPTRIADDRRPGNFFKEIREGVSDRGGAVRSGGEAVHKGRAKGKESRS
jgi:hypothetical protein